MAVGPQVTIGWDTLAFTPTPGFEKWIFDSATGRATKLRWLYNGTGGALAVGTVLRVGYDGDEETNPRVVSVVTALANVYVETVVAWGPATGSGSIPDATWGWFAAQGYVEALCYGATDVDKDDSIKVVYNASYPISFIEDGTARTVNSVGIACAAQTAATETLTLVYLFGERAINQ